MPLLGVLVDVFNDDVNYLPNRCMVRDTEGTWALQIVARFRQPHNYPYAPSRNKPAFI